MLKITLSLKVFEINDIFNFCQNSRWQPKSRSQDKCVFAFYTEIQDGRQKWWQSDCCEMLPVHSADSLRVKNFIKIALSRNVSTINVFFVFYVEIQDGRQKWRESDFCEKSPVDSADNLQVRDFVEITLSQMVFQINLFCILRRNARWPPKNGGKVIIEKCRQYTLQIPCGSKILSKLLYLALFPR